MKSVNHNLEQGGSSTKEHGMRSWMYAILMGDVAYDAAKKHWTVKSSFYPIGSKNFTSEKRSEIFEEIMDQNEIAEGFANKWRAVLDGEGDSFMAARLKDSSFASVLFRRRRRMMVLVPDQLRGSAAHQSLLQDSFF